MQLRRLAALSLILLPIHVCALAAQSEATTTLGGYGEVHYTNRTGAGTPGEATLKRFVLYVAHAFDERLSLRSEVELEDARLESGSPAGEVSVEQLYLDYRLSSALTLRGGLLLPPVGIINEAHEPPTFNGVARPDFDHDVIPTTWREIGVGVAGAMPKFQGLNYRLYLVNGLVAAGFSADEGIRAGRQEGQNAVFANPSITGRLEYVRPGMRVGTSFWYGGSAAQDPLLGKGAFDNAVALLSADARLERGGFALRGVFATIHVADADRINAAYGGAVASRITGGYVEGAYNLLRLLAPRSTQAFNGFVRYERFDTQAEVPAGVMRDATRARRYTTLGVTYKPIYNVAVKGDYQLRRNRARAGEDEVFRLGLGYQF
ncbi:MAG: hypothetical protein H0U85_09700 [Gemmatimonadales bacterium]|nr:hypothetical protein [Gemmatimonadales bacterium]